MSKHQNNGRCTHCQVILNRYPNFFLPLRYWFYELQHRHPIVHCSCAGRGEIEQSAALIRRASKAKWRLSAHNWNAALDLFEMGGNDIKNIYETKVFREIIVPKLPDWIQWYGNPGAPFEELPHFEVKNWKNLALLGQLKLVE